MANDNKALATIGLDELDVNDAPASTDLTITVDPSTYEPKLVAGVGSEEVIGAGAVSVTEKVTKVALVGAGAITLAVPSASMLGVVKTIEMTEDNGVVTLALTNVQGGTASTTATFADVNDALILVGGSLKWHVIGESGVVLS